MLYAGLDLSRQRLDVHVLDEEGRTVEVTAVRPDADALRTLAPSEKLTAQRARLEAASRALQRAVGEGGERRSAQLRASAGRLDSLSPLAVLGRGYAIARRSRDGAIVRRFDAVAPGEGLRVRVAEGEIDTTVDRVRRG